MRVAVVFGLQLVGLVVVGSVIGTALAALSCNPFLLRPLY